MGTQELGSHVPSGTVLGAASGCCHRILGGTGAEQPAQLPGAAGMQCNLHPITGDLIVPRYGRSVWFQLWDVPVPLCRSIPLSLPIDIDDMGFKVLQVDALHKT